MVIDSFPDPKIDYPKKGYGGGSGRPTRDLRLLCDQLNHSLKGAWRTRHPKSPAPCFLKKSIYDVCMHAHTYICICTYIYIYNSMICICIYIYIYTYMYTCHACAEGATGKRCRQGMAAAVAAAFAAAKDAAPAVDDLDEAIFGSLPDSEAL